MSGVYHKYCYDLSLPGLSQSVGPRLASVLKEI